MTIGPWSDLVPADNAVPFDPGPTLGLWSQLRVVDSSVVLPTVIEPWSDLVVATWPQQVRRVLVDGEWLNTARRLQ